MGTPFCPLSALDFLSILTCLFFPKNIRSYRASQPSLQKMTLLFYCNQIILQINLERNDINTRSGSTDSWMFPSSPKLLIHPNETQFSSMKGWWLHLRAYDVGRDDRKAELSWNYPTDTLRVASLAFGSCRVVQLLRWWLDSRESAQRTQGQLCGLRSPLPPFATGEGAHVPPNSKTSTSC